MILLLLVLDVDETVSYFTKAGRYWSYMLNAEEKPTVWLKD